MLCCWTWAATQIWFSKRIVFAGSQWEPIQIVYRKSEGWKVEDTGQFKEVKFKKSLVNWWKFIIINYRDWKTWSFIILAIREAKVIKELVIQLKRAKIAKDECNQWTSWKNQYWKCTKKWKKWDKKSYNKIDNFWKYYWRLVTIE